MSGKNTIIINGKVYDAQSGLPVAEPAKAVSPAKKPVNHVVQKPTVTSSRPSPARTSHHAKKSHLTTQRSETLRRDVLKKPVSKAQVGAAKRASLAGHVAKSPHITRFAPHPQAFDVSVSRKKHVSKPTAASAQLHPIVAQKHALVTPASKVTTPTPKLSSRSLKEQLIKERLASVDTTPSKPHKTVKRVKLFSKQPRLASLVSVSLAVMVLGGYLTYLNMPGLSVRVAAAQAGVAASFPDYHPDGYRFNGPVAYSPVQVAIKFQANGGTADYTLTEQNSSWDSQAVYDNVVSKVGNSDYVTNSQQGLTVYTYNNKAAWVNKGILYTVDGDAPLNNEQLLKIAGSL